MKLNTRQIRSIVEDVLREERGGDITLDIEMKIESLVDLVAVWLEQFDVNTNIIDNVVANLARKVFDAIYDAHDTVAKSSHVRGDA